jgi:glutamate carboxypeptidase
VVTGRKGGVFMRVEVTGKAAHAGGNFEKGVSAIGELAHKVVAMHRLTDLGRGVTVNVGLIKGGQSVNTVAPFAEAEVDLRYIDPADRAQVMAALEAIVAEAIVPGTTARLIVRGEFAPLVATPAADALFTAYRAAAVDAGLECTASSPAAAPIPASRPASAARPCAPPGPWEAMRTRPRSIWRSARSFRARRRWRWRSCACRPNKAEAAQGAGLHTPSPSVLAVRP